MKQTDPFFVSERWKVEVCFYTAKVLSCFCSHDFNLFWDYMTKLDYRKIDVFVWWEHLDFPALIGTLFCFFLPLYC